MINYIQCKFILISRKKTLKTNEILKEINHLKQLNIIKYNKEFSLNEEEFFKKYSNIQVNSEISYELKMNLEKYIKSEINYLDDELNKVKNNYVEEFLNIYYSDNSNSIQPINVNNSLKFLKNLLLAAVPWLTIDHNTTQAVYDDLSDYLEKLHKCNISIIENQVCVIKIGISKKSSK
jgi:hypothetical protein